MFYLQIICQNLFSLFYLGCMGSVMATSKKFHREKENYLGYRHDAIDEFGDVFWYFCAICRRLRINIEPLLLDIKSPFSNTKFLATDLSNWPVAYTLQSGNSLILDQTLLELGQAASSLLDIKKNSPHLKERLSKFLLNYLLSLQASKLSFGEVLIYNLIKTRGRFLPLENQELPSFDIEFEMEEQLPREFEILLSQRKSGKTYIQYRGVFIGDPLTDNIIDKDGYRYHDVFHFSHAAILHWSPVFRALIKHKRKSDPLFDETQDSGRAIVVEEGLTAWIFSQAKRVGFFEGRNTISFDILKTVQRFISGYEVEKCPLKLWEKAILDGYKVFSEVKKNDGGKIIGDLNKRTINYEKL